MRPLLITAFSLIICLASLSQAKDTIFLKRVLSDTPYHYYNAIYIDTTYKLSDRKLITDFSFSMYDSLTYFDELKHLSPLKKTKSSINNFPKRWILLYKYKDEYYTYVPSEAGENYKFEITDSTTIDFTIEGPQPSKLNKITFISPTEILINRENPWKRDTVKIKIINKEKGIAIFTFSPTKYFKTDRQLLMVDVDKTGKFKTIINFCKTDKVAEFDFDKINFNILE